MNYREVDITKGINHFIIVFKTIHSIKKDQKNLQEMYAVLIQKTTLGKKNFITEKNIFDVWDYYSTNYEILFIQFYWIIKTNSMQIYMFYVKTSSNINIQDA